MDANNARTPKQLNVFGTPGTIRTLSIARTPVIDPAKPQTPRNENNQNSTAAFCTPNAMQRKHSRFRQIFNPFEAALTERLHLPLICSPSLFHRPSTPQLSSTQFEWTIEDVSSFNPANVEAHETQFISSVIDPEEEAKFQAAISSYFKDRLLVPSPIDCQLRNKKIILPLRSSAIKRPKRDAICQTELSLPPLLPKEIEDLLRPYFSYTVDQQQSPYKLNCDTSTTMDHDARDASLRRKLFGSSLNASNSSDGDDDLQCSLSALSPPPESPKFGPESWNTRNFDSPERRNQTLDASLSPIKDHTSSSFGSISPISKESTKTPNRFSHHGSLNRNSSFLSSSSIYRSTPDRASVVYRTCSALSIDNMSVDTSAVISSAGSNFMNRSNLARHKSLSTSMHADFDIHMMSTKAKTEPNTSDSNESSELDEDQMATMSELQVSNGSLHLETPTRRRRHRAARKNLSHSFSSSFHNDNVLMSTETATKYELQQYPEEPQTLNCTGIVPNSPMVALSKTDSGFNDMEE